MTDDDSPDTDSRRNRLATHRHRLRAVAVVILVVLIAVGAAVAMTLRNHDKTSAATTHRQETTHDSSPAPDSSIATTRKVEPPRAISHDDPMRLWIGGDSLAGSFGPALGQMAGATGVVKATIDYKVSSGLADNGIRDWYEWCSSSAPMTRRSSTRRTRTTTVCPTGKSTTAPSSTA
jgi:hypothetical protein